SSYWGGTWLAATKYCDMKATAKDIMTKFTIDSDFMMGMAQDGEFVNNVEDMTTIANDTSFALEYLGGQNPFGILLDEAVKIDLSCVGPNDQDINTAFNNAVNSYLAGDVATPDDAITAFTAAVEDLGVI
ncbi:MAG TPA: carbohydrate ABC transporter substrate-binding protein, partial [Bacillota bacterium]|nr:carbohydrate ABC transporter substrate-binding protein [Bacillota bacterium]